MVSDELSLGKYCEALSTSFSLTRVWIGYDSPHAQVKNQGMRQMHLLVLLR